MGRLLQILLFSNAIMAFGSPQDRIRSADECIRENNTKINRLLKEGRKALEEMREGLYCSICYRTKTEIEATGESFSQHLGEVNGKAVPASKAQLEAKAAEYNRKIKAAQNDMRDCEQKRAEALKDANEERKLEAERRRQKREEELRRQQELRQRQVELRNQQIRKHNENVINQLNKNLAQINETTRSVNDGLEKIFEEYKKNSLDNRDEHDVTEVDDNNDQSDQSQYQNQPDYSSAISEKDINQVLTENTDSGVKSGAGAEESPVYADSATPEQWRDSLARGVAPALRFGSKEPPESAAPIKGADNASETYIPTTSTRSGEAQFGKKDYASQEVPAEATSTLQEPGPSKDAISSKRKYGFALTELGDANSPDGSAGNAYNDVQNFIKERLHSVPADAVDDAFQTDFHNPSASVHKAIDDNLNPTKMVTDYFKKRALEKLGNQPVIKGESFNSLVEKMPPEKKLAMESAVGGAKFGSYIFSWNPFKASEAWGRWLSAAKTYIINKFNEAAGIGKKSNPEADGAEN